MEESMKHRQTAARWELKNRRRLVSKKDPFMPWVHIDNIVKGRNPFFIKWHCFDGSSTSPASDEWVKDCYVFVYEPPHGPNMTRYIPKERLEKHMNSGEHPILSIDDKGIKELRKGILSLSYRGREKPGKRALENIAKSIFYYAGESGIPLWKPEKLSYLHYIDGKAEREEPIIRITTLEQGSTLPTIIASIFSGGVLIDERKRDSEKLILVEFAEFEGGLVDLERVSIFPDERRVFDRRAWELA